jgi:hypothetical protein
VLAYFPCHYFVKTKMAYPQPISFKKVSMR